MICARITPILRMVTARPCYLSMPSHMRDLESKSLRVCKAVQVKWELQYPLNNESMQESKLTSRIYGIVMDQLATVVLAGSQY